MSCCGQRRVNLNAGLSAGRSVARTGLVAPMTPSAAAAPLQANASSTGRALEFELVGDAPLNIAGQASGLHYRFAGAGSRLCVDRRDWAQMFRIGELRHVAE